MLNIMMNLFINKNIVIDVELIDQLPSFVKVDRLCVTDQSIILPDSEMNMLLSILTLCSSSFNKNDIIYKDSQTLLWGWHFYKIML